MHLFLKESQVELEKKLEIIRLFLVYYCKIEFVILYTGVLREQASKAVACKLAHLISATNKKLKLFLKCPKLSA